MAQRYFLCLAAASMLIYMHPGSLVSANEFFVGCRTRPACGKVCKLVCEKTTLTVFCYGCECEEICSPGPSRPGCKRCDTCCGEECCAGGCDCGPNGCLNCQDKGPECKFCWRDWIPCGCAKPRTVKVLTKYQAEKEICWYHWEVVDAGCCEHVGENALGASENGEGVQSLDIYKPAPPQAKLGDVLPVSDDERNQLATYLRGDTGPGQGEVANAAQLQPVSVEVPLEAQNQSTAAEGKEKISLRQKLSGILGL